MDLTAQIHEDKLIYGNTEQYSISHNQKIELTKSIDKIDTIIDEMDKYDFKIIIE